MELKSECRSIEQRRVVWTRSFHNKEDETIFVIEGELRAWLGGKQYDVKTGDFVHMPRGVQHYFKNLSEKTTRLLLTYTPGGFEQWFLDVGKPVRDRSR